MKRVATAVTSLILLGCSAPRQATYQMTWRYEQDHMCPTMRPVVLRFVDYPAYIYGYCSDDLARYLASRPGSQVEVVFEVDHPEAQLGGGAPVRVGTLQEWRSEFQHMGMEQDTLTTIPPRHPWEPLRSKRGAT
jgi:hypothetical protein